MCKCALFEITLSFKFLMLEAKIVLPLLIFRSARVHLNHERDVYAMSAFPLYRDASPSRAYKDIDHPFQANWAPQFFSARYYPNYPKQVHKMETYFCQKTNLDIHTAQLNEVYFLSIYSYSLSNLSFGKKQGKYVINLK